MNRVGTFTSSAHHRSGSSAYLQQQSHVFGTSGRPPVVQASGSTHILVGLLVLMSWVALVRVRRRLLRFVYRYLGLYLPPTAGDDSASQESHPVAKKAPKKAPKKSLPRALRKKASASKRHLEMQPDAASETQTQLDAEGRAAAAPAATGCILGGPDDDDDLQDYEIIHTGDAFGDDKDHSN